jgi:glycosyltransferase involved in cell wall biosynthesis
VTDSPLVGIGLPTHNGEPFLALALESLLAQDHRELEIVVSDNASTDRTPEIVQDFMRRDSRIRYDRADGFLTASQNFNRALALSSGTLFMWAADDDLWDPSYVRRCAAALAGDPMAVMASSRLRFIDPAGTVLDSDYDRYDNPDLSSRSLVERVRILLRRGGFYQAYGLARRDALQQTHLFQDIYAPDVVLTLELALLGPIVLVPEPLFFYRRFPERTEAVRAERQGGIADRSAIVAARMTNLEESLSRAIGDSTLSRSQKLRLRAEILRAAYLDDTPMRSRTRHEVRGRTATAWHDHDPGRIAKFGLAWTIERSRGLPRTARRSAARVRRLALRARNRLARPRLDDR